jgi:hypothetical protein
MILYISSSGGWANNIDTADLYPAVYPQSSAQNKSDIKIIGIFFGSLTDSDFFLRKLQTLGAPSIMRGHNPSSGLLHGWSGFGDWSGGFAFGAGTILKI